MSISKSSPWMRQRVRIALTQWGYVVQVYGQTVMRADTYREAVRLGAKLRRAYRRQPLRAAA